MIGLVQERYGYARGDAEEEVDRRLKEYNAKTSGGMTRMEQGNEAATIVGETIPSLLVGFGLGYLLTRRPK